ncbi:hypothetical protein AAFF_G00285360 [Aldrovandia affinis]|uniref:Uncharacterized protein n=1 Tax=Aldrovandia affinis TaxID=143900 RepID=A0AAD7TAC8_9TELE|nr:hypothetical protein AAFF_G00285360 [Aldrovandia affinis]
MVCWLAEQTVVKSVILDRGDRGRNSCTRLTPWSCCENTEASGARLEAVAVADSWRGRHLVSAMAGEGGATSEKPPCEKARSAHPDVSAVRGALCETVGKCEPRHTVQPPSWSAAGRVSVEAAAHISLSLGDGLGRSTHSCMRDSRGISDQDCPQCPRK